MFCFLQGGKPNKVYIYTWHYYRKSEWSKCFLSPSLFILHLVSEYVFVVLLPERAFQVCAIPWSSSLRSRESSSVSLYGLWNMYLEYNPRCLHYLTPTTLLQMLTQLSRKREDNSDEVCWSECHNHTLLLHIMNWLELITHMVLYPAPSWSPDKTFTGKGPTIWEGTGTSL